MKDKAKEIQANRRDMKQKGQIKYRQIETQTNKVN